MEAGTYQPGVYQFAGGILTRVWLIMDHILILIGHLIPIQPPKIETEMIYETVIELNASVVRSWTLQMHM